MSTVEHAGVAKVTAALREAGLPDSADRVVLLDDEVRTAALAAAALGIAPGAIANSLIFTAELKPAEPKPAEPDPAEPETGGQVPLLAMTSGAHRADPGLLAEAIGARTVGKAGAAFVREHTGQAIGGVAPIGHPRRIRTVVDVALAGYPEVWAAAGHPKSVFPITFEQLVTLTGGTPVTVATGA